MRETEKKIEALQKKLYEQQALLLDQEGRRKYYNHLLDVLEIPEEKVKVEDKKTNEDYVKPEVKDKFKEILAGTSYNGSLLDILKQLGILK